MAKIYVQLGRHGDIINLLPILWNDFEMGQRAGIMVAAEFAPLLDGINYADKHIYPGRYDEIGHACEAAEKLGKVVCTQINGPTELVKTFSYGPAGQERAVCRSYQREMWKLAGRLKEWDENYPLIFDGRDPARERQLIDKVIPKRNKKPVLLVSLGGTSSPFQYRELFLDLLQCKLSHSHRVVDLAAVKADKLYDLLGLYERASCLIATDSAPLHLARAVPTLPVVALTNDKPILWRGSDWQPQHVAYCRYGDFLNRFRNLIDVASEAMPRERKAGPQVYHVWNAYDPDCTVTNPDGWIPTPVEPGTCRDSKVHLKDEKALPYLRDALRMGLQRARKEDYVCLSRPGTRIEDVKPCEGYAYRMVKNGNGHLKYQPIVDLFIARKSWWLELLPQIPDLILGSDIYWSQALWALFQSRQAKQLPTGCIWRTK